MMQRVIYWLSLLLVVGIIGQSITGIPLLSSFRSASTDASTPCPSCPPCPSITASSSVSELSTLAPGAILDPQEGFLETSRLPNQQRLEEQREEKIAPSDGVMVLPLYDGIPSFILQGLSYYLSTPNGKNWLNQMAQASPMGRATEAPLQLWESTEDFLSKKPGPLFRCGNEATVALTVWDPSQNRPLIDTPLVYQHALPSTHLAHWVWALLPGMHAGDRRDAIVLRDRLKPWFPAEWPSDTWPEKLLVRLHLQEVKPLSRAVWIQHFEDPSSSQAHLGLCGSTVTAKLRLFSAAGNSIALPLGSRPIQIRVGSSDVPPLLSHLLSFARAGTRHHLLMSREAWSEGVALHRSFQLLSSDPIDPTLLCSVEVIKIQSPLLSH